MTLSPTDRTKLNNLTPNLAPNQIALSALRLAVFQEIYEYLDKIIADLNTAQGIGSVTSTKLADGSVITIKMADGAVTGPKILDSAVVEMKLANGAVTTVKLADLGVTTAKLADFSVTRDKITLGAVGANQLDPALLQNFGDIAVQAKFTQVDAQLAATTNTRTGMMQQALINGNFDVWQRGTSFTNLAPISYTADRWKVAINNLSGTLPTSITHSRQLIAPGDIQSTNYFYRMNTNGTGAGQFRYQLNQVIENGTKLLCGAGKKLTLSFYARSSIAGKRLGASVIQAYGTGGSPSAAETIPGNNFVLTSTWTKYTVTFTTNTLVGKTYGTDNGDALFLVLAYTWDAATQVNYASSTVETFVGAGDIDIAQVQLCSGDAALPFQPLSFAEELILCQRYYEKSKNYIDSPDSQSYRGQLLPYVKGQLLRGVVPFKVKKRIIPTVSVYMIGRIEPNKVLVQSSSITVSKTIHEGYFALQSDDFLGTSGWDFAGFDWESDAEL